MATISVTDAMYRWQGVQTDASEHFKMYMEPRLTLISLNPTAILVLAGKKLNCYRYEEKKNRFI